MPRSRRLRSWSETQASLAKYTHATSSRKTRGCGRRQAAQVVVRDPREIEVAAHRHAGPHRQARVHLEQLERVVARVVRELDLREAAIAGRQQQPQPELEHALVVVHEEDGARPEAQRALAQLAPDDARKRVAAAPDVREQGVDALLRARDQLLHDRLEAVLARSPPRGHGAVDVFGQQELLAEEVRELLPRDGLDEVRRPQSESRIEASSVGVTVAGIGTPALVGLPAADPCAQRCTTSASSGNGRSASSRTSSQWRTRGGRSRPARETAPAARRARPRAGPRAASSSRSRDETMRCVR